MRTFAWFNKLFKFVLLAAVFSSSFGASYAAGVSALYLSAPVAFPFEWARVFIDPVGFVALSARDAIARPKLPENFDPEENLELFLGHISDRRLRQYVGHLVEAREFLSKSERVLAPKLGARELGRRQRNLMMGYLIIWLSENPQGIKFQLGGGPAVGLLQIEPATAIDHLQRALRRDASHPQHKLVARILKQIEPSGALSAQIEDLSYDDKDEEWMRRLMAGHPVIQLLVWRLFVDNAANEVPQTRAGWAEFHAKRWNTAYWCDLEQYNADDGRCRDPRVGLAIPYKTKMMSRLIDRWMLAPMNPTVVEKQRELTKEMRATLKDMGEILGIYKRLTRSLRRVRNAELELNKLQQKTAKGAPITAGMAAKLTPHRDALQALGGRDGELRLARQEADRLALYYKPRGLSETEWEAELKEINEAIGTLKAGVSRLIEEISTHLK